MASSGLSIDLGIAFYNAQNRWCIHTSVLVPRALLSHVQIFFSFIFVHLLDKYGTVFVLFQAFSSHHETV